MPEILSFGPECFEHSEEDLVVPSCEATLSAFAARAPSTCPSKGSPCVMLKGKLASQEVLFKAEVLGIAQTLNLNGWNKIPRNSSSAIHVEKLSGAFCNEDEKINSEENSKEQPRMPSMSCHRQSLTFQSNPAKRAMRLVYLGRWHFSADEFLETVVLIKP